MKNVYMGYMIYNYKKNYLNVWELLTGISEKYNHNIFIFFFHFNTYNILTLILIYKQHYLSYTYSL